MSETRTLDVSTLPPGAFGSRSLTFWGTLGIVIIETTAFGIAIGAYFFLAMRSPAWPPDGVRPPDLMWGTINTLVLLGSIIPNELARRAGERVNLRGVRIWMLLALHTTHIVTDFLDSSVLTALMFTGPIEEHRYVDVEENAVYWYFVVLAWLPIYGVIYWAPRLI
jgi:heme/copper-type cytochrome/quinol oxidase subunit 3